MKTTDPRWLTVAFCLVVCTNTLLPGATFTVKKTTDSGVDTLRDALDKANAMPDADIIVFAITGGGGVKTISPLTSLPHIISPMVIDGWSQGGPGYAGPPLIEISGASCATAGNGLEIKSGATTVQGLIINRFAFAGIALVTNGNNTIKGNYIGTDATGTQARGNTNQGIVIVNSPFNIIGGTNAAARNIISGNRFTGIQLLNSGARFNTIQGNYIGVNLQGTSALPNLHGGIVLNALAGTSNDYPTDNIIGGPAPGGRNVISGNGDAGIMLAAHEAGAVQGPTRNQILGNDIGTDKNGSTAVPNIGPGILMTNATQNMIGSTAVNEGNLISGNSGPGIRFSLARSNSVVGNFIGTDFSGTLNVSNLVGIDIQDSAFNVIGSTNASALNVISGNGLDGINIGGTHATNNLVQGNFIGLKASSPTALANGWSGVSINGDSPSAGPASKNRVEGNFIGGNGEDGIQISSGSTSNHIVGNLIGLSKDGLSRVANLRHGVALFDSTNNFIGGPGGTGGNLISGNNSNGVFIGTGDLGTGSVSNYVRGNQIGSDFGNGAAGVFIQGNGNMVGGFAILDANSIAFNGTNLPRRGHGVVVQSGTNNPILGNLIWGNSGRAIDLGNDSFTVNDFDDSDTGGNDLLNYPVVTRVGFATPGVKEVTWTLNTDKTNRTYRIEFFSNEQVDPSGFGEGQMFISSTDVTTDQYGIIVFTNQFLAGTRFISATATDKQEMNTSEFSPVDTDGDAIADAWETLGIDYNEDGVMDLILAGAKPLHKDIFVEVDAMLGRAPTAEAVKMLSSGVDGVGGFDRAPQQLVQNPDLGTGIKLHLELDEPNLQVVAWTNATPWPTQFNLTKLGTTANHSDGRFGKVSERLSANWTNIMAARKLVYRYCIVAESVPGGAGGQGEVSGNDFYIAQGVNSDETFAAAFMHELGHTLGMQHGGFEETNNKPNYHSIMNYTWTDRASGYPEGWRLDYSRETLPVLVETNLSESAGFGGNPAFRVPIGPRLDPVTGNVRPAQLVREGGPVDLNGNGTTNDVVTRDINFVVADANADGVTNAADASPGDRLVGQEDWSKLTYYFLESPAAKDGRHDGAVTNDIPAAVLEELDRIGTGLGVFEFNPVNYTVTETGVVAIISVKRAFEAEANVSVSFSSVNGSATNGLDYVATNGVLSFTGAEALKVFAVPILNDGVAEELETVQVVLSNPTGGATLGQRSQATISIIDEDPPSLFTVSSTNNGGAGSLRQAILDANSATGLAIIDFNIPVTNSLTISPASALPTLTRPVTIDGTTQPGFAGVPIIELNGTSAGAGSDGLRISAVHCTVRGLVINRFSGNGINLLTGGQNLIEGCYIGLNRQGTLDQGNTNNGINIQSAGNIIGGLTSTARNFISGNNAAGILISGASANNNQVLGNVIGLGVDNSDQGNTTSGISISSASTNTIGGLEEGAGNVISGNDQDGVNIPLGLGTRVLGNYIGTDMAGASARGNGRNGIKVLNFGASIGGNDPAAGNLISGNAARGIEISAGAGIVVLGNKIGTDATGQNPLPNQAGGIVLNIQAQGNQIGWPTGAVDFASLPFPANTIAFNNGPGIFLADNFAVRNVLRGNALFSNTQAGIALTPFSGGNDTNDTDVGANDLQNYPVLTSASNSANGTIIIGTLNSRPNATFTLDFYSNLSPDTLGTGEGERWLASTNVTTDNGGNVAFTFSSPAISLRGRYITATATDAAGNTSEFSAPVFAHTSIPGRTFTVVNANDSGGGSLRQALLDANAFVSALDTIEFNIPGSGSHTIRPLSPFPVIEDPVVIDGYTQPGTSPNTALTGDNGVLLIELDGSLMPITPVPGSVSGIGYGLRIRGGDSIVRGFVINRFGTNAALFDLVGGIEISARGGNRIEGNFIGTDPTGMAGRGNLAVGILINGSSNHVIGGTSPDQRNVISGTQHILFGGLLRLGNGISLGNNTANNRIEGNLIGTAADGVTPMGNGGFGIGYNGGAAATNTAIGGTLPGSGNVIAFNGLLLSDNSFQGGGIQDPINIGSSPILGNSIHSNQGLGIQGNLVNSVDGRGNFPLLSSAFSSNGITTIQGRLFSVSNALHRIELFANDTFDPSSHGEGKIFLGATNVPTDSNGFVAFTAVLPVAVSNGTFLTATATDDRNNTSEFSPRLTMGDVLTNVIVVNSINEVDDGVANATHTSLREAIWAANNHPGPDTIRFAVPAGFPPGPRTIGVSNSPPALMDAGTTIDATTQPGFAGQPLIYLNGLGLSPVGFRLYSPSNTIRGFAINLFGTGIYGDATFCSPSGGFNVIEGNYLGTDAAGGSAGFQNRGITFLFPGCSSNRIGGTSIAARNVISGNSFNNGIGIAIGASDGNTIQGNFIGISPNGSNAVPNTIGIHVSGQGSMVGGGAPGARNVISANVFDQVNLSFGTVQGNFIGTDVTGMTNVGNSVNSVVAGSQVLIKSNLICRPISLGISNRVEGNFIGTDVTGTRSIPCPSGIQIAGTGNVIGGTNPGSGNLISGGTNVFFGGGIGIRIQGPANILQGNFIGTQIDGVSPIGNHFGVTVENSFNLIGGSGAGAANVIAFTAAAGISVTSGTDNAILGNSIFSNTGLGLDLGVLGVTTNDFGDLDAGANNLQNFPLLTAARNIGSGTIFQGALNSRSNTTFRIEFFSNTNCHASGHGQGRTFLNATTATTDPSGNATIFFTHPAPIPAGQFITATATDPNNNTSEFSPCVTVTSDTNYVVLSFTTVNPYTLSWPTSASNFLLERATNLTPPTVWLVISNGIVTNAGHHVFAITNDPVAANQFFRLRKP